MRKSVFHSLAKLAWAVALCIAAAFVAHARADYFDDIGYRTLRDRGVLRRNGAGLSIAQVESPAGGDYVPNQASTDFAGKTFTLLSGASAPSPHATDVAGVCYGRSSGLAPSMTNIKCFAANDFVDRAMGLGNMYAAPLNLGVSVVNNSWIGSEPTPADNVETIRRLDYLINRDNLVCVNAVDNLAGGAIPQLLGTSYNGITVGKSSGSSAGPVSFDGVSGRIKPDIVAPLGTTSEAAGVISGAAALLMSEAKARNMIQSELATKAMLMAGAQRNIAWQHGATGLADDVTSPLDYRQGAGQLRIDNSYHIMASGQQKPAVADALSGWDKRAMTNGTKGVDYLLTLKATMPHFSAVLTWNRKIAGFVNSVFQTTPTLSDLKLLLYRVNGTKVTQVGKSDSKVDNVEMLTLANLPAGNYRLSVRGNAPETYGLAWFSDPTIVPAVVPKDLPITGVSGASGAAAFTSSVPEPGTLAFLAGGLLALRRRR